MLEPVLIIEVSLSEDNCSYLSSCTKGMRNLGLSLSWWSYMGVTQMPETCWVVFRTFVYFFLIWKLGFELHELAEQHLITPSSWVGFVFFLVCIPCLVLSIDFGFCHCDIDLVCVVSTTRLQIVIITVRQQTVILCILCVLFYMS